MMAAKPELFIGCIRGDCGCPEESYIVNGIDLTVHFEPDGTADAFMEGGDWGGCETSIEGYSRFAARLAVFAWANSMTQEPSMSDRALKSREQSPR